MTGEGQGTLNPTLKRLAELQRIDAEVAQAKKRLEDLPGQLKTHREKIKRGDEEVAVIDVQIAEVETKRRECESTLRDCDSKIKSLEEQTLSVTTQKQFEAIKTEIATIKERGSETEDSELELLEQEETLTQKRDKLAEEISGQRARAEAEIERLVVLKIEDEKTLIVLETDRSPTASEIPDEIIDRYDVLRMNFPTNATAPITPQETCGGCQMMLVNQTLMSLRHGRDLTLCEHCGRILYPNDL